jgi:hypothetical protein
MKLHVIYDVFRFLGFEKINRNVYLSLLGPESLICLKGSKIFHTSILRVSNRPYKNVFQTVTETTDDITSWTERKASSSP